MARMIHSHIAAISRLVNVYNHMDFTAVPITQVFRTNIFFFLTDVPHSCLAV